MTPPFVDYVLHGWKLTPVQPGTKGPRTPGWQQESAAVGTVERAQVLQGAGLCHAWSGTCAVDVDDLEAVRAQLPGIDDWINADDAVRIERGDPNRTKLLYALPAPLPTVKPFPGLELRCGTRNGLTVHDVLPPSQHPSGEPYRWAYANDLIGDWRHLPPLPDALRAYWEAQLTAHIAESDKGEVTDADELCKLLDGLDPDVGYDEWLRIGMALHHASHGAEAGLLLWDRWSSGGAKYGGYADLQSHWRSFRSDTPGAVTVNSLRNLKVASPDDFDVVEAPPAPEVEDEAPRFRLVPAAEWAKRPPPTWLVDQVFPQGGLAMVYGPSNSGKSFWVLDLAMHVASGREWLGRATRPGAVAWIAAEASGSMRNRMLSYAWWYGQSLSDINLHITGEAPNLGQLDDVKALIAATKGVEPELVIVDTLAAASGGANENSGEDMNSVMAACRAIQRNTGACVLLIHHTGKDKARGARGWSGIQAAMDTEVELLDAGDGLRTARLTKQRDAECNAEWAFTLASVYTNESCAVVHVGD